ncbi:MAG: hypothetical protein JWO19_5007 [Bryobacterales bacterium]|nr:hypothetical protein [Bryobacterales bacterium]
MSAVTARIAIFGLVAAAASGAHAQSPVVVELFTSEGCSSCPPADQLLSRLDSPRYVPPGSNIAGRAKQAISLPPGVEVIALGEHVDYWDELGWKDRFSSPLFSARQQDYGKAFHLESVYTPQIVVNGQKEVLGSESRAVQDAITKAAKDPHAQVTLSMTSVQTFSYSVSKLPPGSHEADILLGVAEGRLVTPVYGGENNGRQLVHAAVVRSLTSLGRLDPKRPGEYSGVAQLNLRQDWVRANLKLVLFVQDRTTRRILGAASVRP